MATVHVRLSPPAMRSPRVSSQTSSPSTHIRYPATNFPASYLTLATKTMPATTTTTVRCGGGSGEALKTCKHCKAQFNPSSNHPRACRFHTAHFGGETRRKFESVYSGGTMNTPDSGKVFQYWHCCGSEDPFDPGCTAGLHSSYDDE